MAQMTEAQAKAVQKYEDALERWLGEITDEDIAKVLDKLSQWEKLPYARLVNLYLDLCTHCGACANECHIYKACPQDKFNPASRAELLRSVYNRYLTRRGKILRGLVGAKELDKDMLKQWFKSFYECTMCRRCNVFCPLGVDNMAIVRTGRVLISAALGKTTEDMARGAMYHVNSGNSAGMNEAAFRKVVEFWEEEIHDKRGWDLKVPLDRVGAEIYLIPTNTDYFLSLETMEGITATLYAAKADWTMSSRIFDSVNYGTFFDDGVWGEILGQHMEEAKRLKCKTLVVGECGHATKSLMVLGPSLLGPPQYEVKNILELTAEYIEQGKIKLDKAANTEPVTYHDPCNLSRLCGIIDEPRTILKAVCMDFREMTPNRDKNYCCGGGGGIALETAAHDYRMEFTGKMKAEQLKQTGAKWVATTCANCKVQLAHLIEYYKLDMQMCGVHDLVLNALVL